MKVHEVQTFTEIRYIFNDAPSETAFHLSTIEFTLLHVAAQNNLAASAQILLEKGANVNARTSTVNTPLRMAVMGTRRLPTPPVSICPDALEIPIVIGYEEQNSIEDTLEVQKVLIANGADMDIRTWSNTNASLVVEYIRGGHYELAKLAIENGADVRIRNALWHAKQSGNTELISMIEERLAAE